MSSGSETRQRRQLLPVRCTPEELAELRTAKEAGGFDTMAEFVRARCLRASRAPKVSRAERQEFARLLAEAGKIGSNINQMARVANQHGELPAAAMLETIWQEVSRIRSALMKALGHGD